jgi:glycosyltransferase involved in cell wall biosynthesis
VRVAFVSQLPFSLAFGGLEIQVLETAKALRELGVDVELLNPWEPEFTADLLHCFSSEYQLWEIVSRAKGKGIPVVVSAIFGPKAPEAFYRLWRWVDPIVPMQTTFRLRAKILRAAEATIVHSEPEAEDLVRFFGVSRERIHIIPNGVRALGEGDPERFANQFGLRRFALCVAGIERRKNQLRLIRAVRGTDIPLVLIGAPRPDEAGYVEAVRRAVRESGQVVWIEGLPPDSLLLASAYRVAHVHVLPSLSEGQGMASLEAAAAGANLVMSNLPYLRELFGDYAWYCNPRSVGSIRKAVLEAWEAPRGARYVSPPPWLISWEEVARRLLAVYEGVLNKTR